jgi:putative oxidoreductase
LGTRLAAIPLLITMLVAVLIVHSADAFGNKELALLYAVIYLTLIFTGGGKFSADKLLF